MKQFKEVGCNSCYYHWQPRNSQHPDRCPACGSIDIQVVRKGVLDHLKYKYRTEILVVVALVIEKLLDVF